MTSSKDQCLCDAQFELQLQLRLGDATGQAVSENSQRPNGRKLLQFSSRPPVAYMQRLGCDSTLRLNWVNGFINYKHAGPDRTQRRLIVVLWIGTPGLNGHSETKLAFGSGMGS
jgi:hypothetical protein